VGHSRARFAHQPVLTAVLLAAAVVLAVSAWLAWRNLGANAVADFNFASLLIMVGGHVALGLGLAGAIASSESSIGNRKGLYGVPIFLFLVGLLAFAIGASRNATFSGILDGEMAVIALLQVLSLVAEKLLDFFGVRKAPGKTA
jgi:hypothetical protein